jgi:hypothetical protein
LIDEYMDLDGASLREQPLDIEIVTHGCGENFPLDEASRGLDEAPAENTREQEDRRVELFFFDKELGVQPPVGDGSNSKAKSAEYPEWRRRAVELRELTGEARALIIKLLDPLNEPLRDAPYELVVGQETRTGKTDQNGILHERDLPVPNRCTLRWAYPNAPDEPEDDPVEFQFEREMFLDYAQPDDQDVDEAARRRLSNLGYQEPALTANVRQFQRDFGLPEQAWFDQATFDRLREVHDEL